MQSSRRQFLRLIRRVWHVVPKPLRWLIWRIGGDRAQYAHALRSIAKPSRVYPAESNCSIVVAGLFSTASGIGEAARATFRALNNAGLEPLAVNLSEHFAPVDAVYDINCVEFPPDFTGILILQMNGPETMAALQRLGMKRGGRHWYTIGYWAWELPNFPKSWDRAFPMLSEIWTISDFAANALERHQKAPVIRVVPHTISAPRTPLNIRAQFGWTDEQFVFLTMADGMSSLTRKNPFATIRAFKSAFGDDPRYRLMIKTRNLDHKPEAKADLLETIRDAENIEILDESLSEDDRWALLNSVDCFVSLHRSEGFGLVLAEAMALGKPVICTNWSGNTDFTSEETSLLVDYELVPCEDPYGIYTDTSAHWAEVDLADAVAKMTKVASDSSYREQIGAAAKQHIEAWASAERIGKLMADRLSSIPVAPAPKP